MSEKYVISERGNELNRLVQTVKPIIEKKFRKDTYLRIMMDNSRSFIE